MVDIDCDSLQIIDSYYLMKIACLMHCTRHAATLEALYILSSL